MLNNKQIYALSCILFAFQFLTAQIQVEGTVIENSIPVKKMISDAVVEWISLDSGSSAYLTLTDDNGNYKLVVDSVGSYLRTVSHLNYQMQIDTILLNYTTGRLPDIHLVPKLFLMPEVEILENRMLIQRKGDTTRYDIKRLLNGQEDNASEIISKLPGLSVENGVIKFQNEAVKYVLIDGMDIQRFRHTSLLDRLEANKVDAVEVIENYNEGASSDTIFESGHTAVNIKTKREFWGELDVELSAGLGLDDTYVAKLETFKNDENLLVQIDLSSNGNYHESENVSHSIGQVIRSFEHQQLFEPDGVAIRENLIDDILEGVLDKNIIDQNQSFHIHDALFSATINSDNQDIHKIRISSGFGDRESSRTQIRVYTDQNDIQFIEEHKESDTKYVNARYFYKTKLGKVGNLSLNCPINYEQESANIIQSGEILDLKYDLPNLRTTENVQISPSLILYLKNKNISKSRNIIFGQFEHERETSLLQGKSSQPFAPFTKPDPDNVTYGLNMKNDNQSTTAVLGWDYQRKHDTWEMKSNLSIQRLNNQVAYIQTSGSKRPFDGRQSLQRELIRHFLKTTKRLKFLKASIWLTSSFNLTHFEFTDVPVWNLWPGADLRFDLKKNWQVYFVYKPTIQLNQLQQVTTLLKYEDLFSLSSGGVKVNTTSTNNGVALGLRRRLIGDRSFQLINIHVGYSPKNKNMILRTLNRDSILHTSYFSTIDSDAWTFRVTWMKHHKDWRFSSTIDGASRNQKVFFDTFQSNEKYLNAKGQAKLSFSIIKEVAIGLNARYQLTQREVASRVLRNSMIDLAMPIHIKWSSFDLKINSSHQQNFIGGDHVDTQWGMNFRIECRKVLKCVNMFVQVQNLFQDNNQYLYTNITAQYTGFTQYDNRGMTCLFGVKWKP